MSTQASDVPFVSVAPLRRWLRSGAGDVITIAPARRERQPSTLGMRGGLPRWRRRIERRRGVVLTRRWLLLGLVVASALELLAAAVGAADRALWLAAPGAVVLAGVGAGLRTRIASSQATLLLDRQLGLSERLTTALELSSGEVAAGSLGALVLSEADAAIDQSLARSRAVDASPAREWLAVLASAVVLIAAFALGGTGAGSQSAAGTSASTRGVGPGVRTHTSPSRPASSTAKTPAAPARASSRVSQPTTSSKTTAVGRSAQPTKSATGHGRTAGTSTDVQAQTRGTASRFASRAPSSTGRGTSSASSSHSAGGSSTQASTSKTSPQTKAGATASPGVLATRIAGGSRAGTSAKSTSRATHSSAAATPAGAGSPAATRGAGATAGRTTGLSNRAARTQDKGSSTLPIQSGYTASHQRHGSSGTVGEGSAGHAAGQAQGELASSSESSTAPFAFIPPSYGGAPYSDTKLLLGYFGPFASLAGLQW
jgi:hypothetical protein